jgi:hypothetical protein
MYLVTEPDGRTPLLYQLRVSRVVCGVVLPPERRPHHRTLVFGPPPVTRYMETRHKMNADRHVRMNRYE